MKYLIMEDFSGQPVPFIFPRRVDHADMRDQLPYGQVISAGVVEHGPEGFVCHGGNAELKSRPGRRRTRPSSPRPCASGKALPAKDGEESLRGDPLISAADARSCLRRNGHGPAGRHPAAAGAREALPPSFPQRVFSNGRKSTGQASFTRACVADILYLP